MFDGDIQRLYQLQQRVHQHDFKACLEAYEYASPDIHGSPWL